MGFDRRAFTSSGVLVLGDVVVSAVVDALLGAAGLGETPRADSDPSEEEDGSEHALREAVRLVERENYQVVNLDISVVTEGLEISRHFASVSERIADVVHVSPVNVAVKHAGRGRLVWLEAPAGGTGGVVAVAVALLNQVADLDALHASIRSGG